MVKIIQYVEFAENSARNFKMRELSLFLLGLLLVGNSKALGWQERAHSVITEAAIHLVRDKNLKTYLLNNQISLIYLANLPDSHWKMLKESPYEEQTHFLESDHIGLDLKSLPLRFSDFKTLSEGRINTHSRVPIRSAARELGTLWWRADQMIRRAQSKALDANQHQRDSDLYSKHMQDMLIAMGLLSHYIGDLGQPLHNTSDFDGWSTGHGGIHFYYESQIVSQIPYDALAKIIHLSPAVQRELQLERFTIPLEKIRQLAIVSYLDLPHLFALDPLSKKSAFENKHGLELKTPAQRTDKDPINPKLKEFVIRQWTRSAVLLAHFWDMIYKSSGEPPLKPNSKYSFPHLAPYIQPDYLE